MYPEYPSRTFDIEMNQKYLLFLPNPDRLQTSELQLLVSYSQEKRGNLPPTTILSEL